MRKTSFNIAFGGVISALCIVLEFSVGIAPVFLYVFPMICSLLMNILLDECGLKVSASAYVGVSVISFLICPDKEAAMMYAAFFGYYPIARYYIHKLHSGGLRFILKLLMFNAAMICSYILIIKIIGLEAAGLDSEKWIWAILLAVGNIAFFFFDIVLERFLTLYSLKYKGRLFGGRRK